MSAATKVRPAELASTLRPALLRLTRLVRLQSGDNSVSLGQLAALGTVSHKGPMSAGELAEHERVQPPSMTKIISALEQRGLVTRAPHPTDGRQVVIDATDAGRELILSTRKLRTAWLSQRLAELTAHERAVLAEAAPILEKLAQR
ncbi:MAG: MarR family winged helix-turn-helix transcriptional regulator [Jatrophihabitans sp.]